MFDRCPVPPYQSAHIFFGAAPWDDGSGTRETAAFVSQKLKDVLYGRDAEISDPPPIDLLCNHIAKVKQFALSILVFDSLHRTRAHLFDPFKILRPVTSYTAGDEILFNASCPVHTPTYPSFHTPPFSLSTIPLPLILLFYGTCLPNSAQGICSYQASHLAQVMQH